MLVSVVLLAKLCVIKTGSPRKDDRSWVAIDAGRLASESALGLSIFSAARAALSKSPKDAPELLGSCSGLSLDLVASDLQPFPLN